MTETVLRGRATHSESRPDECFCVKDSDIVKVALLESRALFTTSSTLHVLFVEVETSVNDQV